MAAKCLLKSLGLRNFGPQIISCPTCGRCEVNLFKVVKELENKLQSMNFESAARPVEVAVMGCVVNGPGEAKHADLGIAFGKKDGLLFKKGKPTAKVSVDRCVNVIMEEIRKLV